MAFPLPRTAGAWTAGCTAAAAVVRSQGVQPWKDEYPWLRLAFRQSGAGGKAAADEWRWRIEEDLKAPLDYQLRDDGTAVLWCGLTSHEFGHEPTPKELLAGLDDAYRRELERRGLEYPRLGRVNVATGGGLVEISTGARDALAAEIRRRGGADEVAAAVERGDARHPIELDRDGTIVVFDTIWAMAEAAGGYDLIDPQLRELRDELKAELARGPKTRS